MAEHILVISGDVIGETKSKMAESSSSSDNLVNCGVSSPKSNGEEICFKKAVDDTEEGDSQQQLPSEKVGERNCEEDESTDEVLSSLDPAALRAKVEQESLEFAFLKPICAQVLQNPSAENLKVFEAALEEIGKVPVHLSEFVAFPFAIHLKVVKTYKEAQRINIFQTLAKLLEKAELCKSYDIFVNIFQKLHISLSVAPNVTAVNTKMSEEEVEAIVTCIRNLSLTSLPYHFDSFCAPDKVQIFGHSIFMLLQLVAPSFSKPIRLKTLRTLEQLVKLCDGSELRSKVLYKFLPGIVSSLRKVCLPSAGNSAKAIIIKSLEIIGMTIRVSMEFEILANLVQADSMLSQIVELLSKDFVLNPDVHFRQSFFEFCCEITARKAQLPNCCKSVTTILMRMKEDDESSISLGCIEALQSGGLLQNLGFTDLTNLLKSASTSLNSDNQVACVLALREISSTLSSIKLSFLDFQTLLPLLFGFINEMVWKLRSVVTVEKKKASDPVYIASCRVCQNLALSTDPDEVVFEFMSIFSEMQNHFQAVENPTGIIAVFNIILPVIHEMSPTKISDFEAANLAEIYLYLLDLQSTDIAQQSIAADIPAVQSAADIRRSYILEGLGILGEIFPNNVPTIMYPLIEHAGTAFQNSEVVNEIAEAVLKRLSGPHTLENFLRENLNLILNEISVRMLNLLLYPNCPHAMSFLAQYFDFSNESFAGLIDQIFDRSSDEFGGGNNVQHIYVKVFYALLKSIFHHYEESPTSANKVEEEKSTLLQKMVAYQKAIGVVPPSSMEADKDSEILQERKSEEDKKETEGEEESTNQETSDDQEVLNPVLLLVERVCHRLLNFLPNPDRIVRLTAMDSLVLGVQLLAVNENSILPLSHSIWENLIPRIDERDYVVVRKSFELLQALCISSGTFLRKRTIEEAFPRLSILLLNLAKEGEQVKDKNRQYYTCTQAYKLQLTILQGLGPLLHCIDVQEFELDKIVSGCILYLNPNQHKNLREAAMKLLENISTGKHCRAVWMKLVASGVIKMSQNLPDPSFTPLPL